MGEKQIKVLIPLGALLLALVVLAGCRPSETLTQLMNAMNALNPSTEDMKTEDEENESEPDDKMDPIDETRDDAQIEATEELIGQMLENMDWETAQESLMAVYSASAGSSEWGAQQYNPDRLTYGSGNGNSPLVLNVKGDEVNSASKIAGSGEGSGTGTASVIETTDALNDEGEETALPLTDPDDTDLDDNNEQIGEHNDDDSGIDADDGDGENDPVDGGSIDPGDGDPGDPDPNEGGTSSAPDNSHEPWGNAGKRIAATGELANVVCMLGGADRLCATSSSFNSNDLAQEAFNSGGQMEYGTLWDGDGSYWLDNGDPDGDTFKYLMEYWEPDVVFDFNYTSFSSDQAKRIENEYNKKYVPIAAMTSQSNINSCMSTVAGYIDSAGNSSASNKVKEYQDWVNTEINALGDVQKYCGQAETVFIEDWDNSVQTIYAPGNTRMTVATGAAVIKIGCSFRPLNECLKNAEVYDWAASPHTRGYKLDSGYGPGLTTGDKLLGMYLWIDLTGNQDYDFLGTSPGSLCYVTPVYDPVFAENMYDQSVWFEGGQYEAIDNSMVKTDGTYTADGRLSFGNVFPGYIDGTTDKWNTIIVKNEYIKGQLEKDEAWTYNSKYDTWSANRSVGLSVTYNGILHPLNGSTYYTTVADQYDVVVNPKGLGDWVEGSPESILESIWAGWRIQGYHTEDYVRGRIQDFYSKFYGLNLDSNGKEITDILNAKYVN